ncbi:toll-like receptor 4 [Acipenser ruthenus]|uniref:toll-like receptor 4 n=1 Tax=Acipenser ruthenus TaxID=7906 RepID=UPI00145A8B15|nr:toll-like receptor 4 [Acipenser ruthenus]
MDFQKCLVFLCTLVVLHAVLSFETSVSGNKCKETLANISFSCMRLNLHSIPPEIPSSAEKLDFSFNDLGTLHRNSFPSLPYLNFLDLTRCGIKLIADDAFQNVNNLTILILTGNPIKQLEEKSFHSLHNLQKLTVVDTGLSALEKLPISHLAQLQELKAGKNNISSLEMPLYVFNLTSLRLLDLHSNNISSISLRDTTVLRKMHLTNLTLILTQNHISYVESGAFDGVILRELHLRSAFDFPYAKNCCLKAMAGLKVDKLVLGNYRNTKLVTTSGCGPLDGLCMIKFQEIHISINDLPSHYPNTSDIFHCLVNARAIKILNCMLTGLKVPIFPKLKLLDLSYNNFENLPAAELSNQNTLETFRITGNWFLTSFNSGFSNMSSLKNIDISNNHITMRQCCIPQFSGADQLIILNMSYNPEIRFEGLAFDGIGNLEILDLRYTKIGGFGGYPLLKNLKKLSYLDISYTGTHFTSENALEGLVNLKVLKAPGNRFHRHIVNFMHNPELELLDISHCQIDHLPQSTFKDLKNLQHLDVSHNKLTAIDFITNPSLNTLTLIDLSNNIIPGIPQSILDHLPKKNIVFDISQNPIECTCDYFSFFKWAIEHKAMLKNTDELLCKSPLSLTNTRVIDTDICKAKTLFIGVTIGILILLSAIAASIYKYQFHLLYCWILMKGYRSTQLQECKFDAFVVYSSHDENWVMDELVENLENGVPPIELCLHNRDFQPGQLITSNILEEGIMSSRKVIVVLSKNFIASRWCKFEFDMARSWQFLEGTPGIIVIVLEDIKEEEIKHVFRLHKYLKKNTYLKWKDNALSSTRFWTRLRKAVLSGKR